MYLGDIACISSVDIGAHGILYVSNHMYIGTVRKVRRVAIVVNGKYRPRCGGVLVVEVEDVVNRIV